MWPKFAYVKDFNDGSDRLNRHVMKKHSILIGVQLSDGW